MYFRRKRQRDWLEVIEKAIERLESGEQTAFLTVYCAFAAGDRGQMRRAGRAIGRELKTYSQKQMIELYERFRSFTSLEWSIDWAALSLDRILKALEETDRKYVLILGSFHPNGYFRERCMEALAEKSGVLSYLMLRANDWVKPVRERAFALLDTYVRQCDTGEILSALPVLEKLERSGRRGDGQMEELKGRIFVRLEQTLKASDWSALWPEDFSVRKSLYGISMEMGILTLEQMNGWLQREQNSCGKMILLKGILSHPDCSLPWAEGYLSCPNGQVRKKALEYKYEHLKTSWPGLEKFLLDSCRGVREYAVYILERHTSLDIRDYYLTHLKEDSPKYAILGLSEYSHRGNVPVLLEYLQKPDRRVQRCVLLALGRQEDFKEEELLWNYLLDERVELAKAAYLSIRKREFYPGAKRIYEAYLEAREGHTRRYLLRLLVRESSWSRLPWLIRLYDQPLPEQEFRLICGGLGSRFMYGNVPAAQKEEIYRALEEKRGVIPEKLAKEILYDMKFV